MANYLEKEAKAKKEARKARMGKGKTTIEKLDITLEEIMKEPDLEGKIKELEAELKLAQEVATGARSKADTVGEDKRERDEKGAAKFAEYKKGIEGTAQTAESKSKALAKKLQFYKAFKENGKQILNIRAYQIELQKRLEDLESRRKLATQQQKGVEKVDSILKKLEDDLAKAMEQKREIDAKLKDGKTSDDERKKLEAEKTKIDDLISTNNKLYSEVSTKRSKIKEPDTNGTDKLSSEITSTQIKISKCNMIWTSLLKGKKWDEIEAILNTGDFTAKKGTLSKIRDLANRQKEIDLEQIQEQTGKNVREILEGKKGRTEGSSEQEQKGEEQEEVEEEQEEQEDLEEGQELPTKVQSFAERHPRLAKIPFLAKFMDNRAEKKKQKAMAKAEAEKEETPIEEVSDKDLSYIDRQMNKGREAEIFRSIADKGIRETVKVDSETQYRLMKVAAAKAQAEKFQQHDKSGRYKEQAKEEEEKGMEPGE